MATSGSKTSGAPPAAGGADAEGGNWPPLETEIVTFTPEELKALDGQPVNARFMTAAQQGQLTENMKRDGAATSALLVYRDPDTGKLEILSGHHRRDSAVDAELPCPGIIITTRLSDQRKKAIQLSHNAIVGQDDMATLAQLYAGLDLTAKSYSGLDDSVVGNLAKIQLAGLGLSIKYQEMNLFFLSEDAGVVAEAMDRIDKAARKHQAYVARCADWEEFFALMVRAKAKFQVFNSGIAFRMLIDLCMAELDRLDAEEPAANA
jgi:hypothetical protein